LNLWSFSSEMSLPILTVAICFVPPSLFCYTHYSTFTVFVNSFHNEFSLYMPG
jgi:hypothetical protein